MVYEVNKIYQLKVSGVLDLPDGTYYKVTDDEQDYLLKQLDFQKDLSLPVVLPCFVTRLEEDGTPVFIQDRNYILHSFYKINEHYLFTVTSSPDFRGREELYYTLKDKYGFGFRLYNYRNTLLFVGQTVTCKVSRIDSKGIIVLSLILDERVKMPFFVSADVLFDEIHFPGFQERFFEGLSDRVLTSGPFINYYSLYESRSPLWILAFLSTLRMEWRSHWSDIEYVATLTELYVRIIRWIMEDTDFLLYFTEEGRRSIRKDEEERLSRASARLDAIQLIQAGESEEYIHDILRKLEVSGYLIDKERKIKTAAAVLLFGPEAVYEETDSLIKLIRLVHEADVIPEVDKHILFERLKLRIQAVDRCLFGECKKAADRTKLLEELIRLTGTEWLLGREQGIEVNFTVLASRIYGYLSLAEEKYAEKFRQYALDVLVCGGGNELNLNWNELIDFSLTAFSGRMSLGSPVPGVPDPVLRKFEGKGKLLLDKDRVLLVPYPDMGEPLEELLEVVSLIGEKLKIVAGKKLKRILPEEYDLSVIRRYWKNLFEWFAGPPQKLYSLAKGRPPVGTYVKIRVKNTVPSLPLLVFVGIEDDLYEGSGVIHAKEITRIKLTSLEKVLKTGDVMTARVIESTEERLGFSILEELDLFVSQHYFPEESTCACLLSKRKDLWVWVSEEGYSLYSSPCLPFDPKPGEYFRLTLKEVNSNGYIKACVEEPSTTPFDVHEAVSRLVFKYLDIPSEVRTGKTKKKNEISREEALLSEAFVVQLERVLELFIFSGKSLSEKFNFVSFIRLLAYMREDMATVEYCSFQLSYMLTVYGFLSGKLTAPPVPDEIIPEEMAERYGVLKRMKTILSLLSAWMEPLKNSELLRATEMEGDAEIQAVARLILASNMLQSSVMEAAPLRMELKMELAHLLGVVFISESPQEETLVSFGSEGEHAEFKTTVVFPPGYGGNANMAVQMDYILRAICGFLNAGGGTLYIGVNDDGVPTGIEPDFFQLHCDEDSYQRMIRGFIVEYFSKDINGLLSFAFRKYNGKTVCAIGIPPYHTVVSLKGEVWQRQGNATRPVDGTDLKLLKERRKSFGLSQKSAVPVFPEDFTVKEQPESFKLTEQAGRSSQGKKNRSEKKKRILTSLLRTAENEGENVLAYFSILDSDKYVLTDKENRREDLRVSLPIYEGDENSLLVQVYENGSINRVTVGTLLKKKRGYEYQNAFCQQSSLIFVAFAREDNYLFIKTAFKGEEYIKIITLNKFKINTVLAHKGLPIFTVPFDGFVQLDILTPAEADNLKHIHTEAPTTLGSPVRSLSVVQDIIYLKNLFGAKKEVVI